MPRGYARVVMVCEIFWVEDRGGGASESADQYAALAFGTHHIAAAHRARKAVQRQARGARFDRHRPHAELRVGPSAARFGADEAADLEGRRGQRSRFEEEIEIERASGRERVCQYV